MTVEAAEFAGDRESTLKYRILPAFTWAFILLFVTSTIVQGSGLVADPNGIMQMISLLCIAVFAWAHGTQRYGIKKMLLWFLIAWAVSNFFEALSIKTGFPFGHYHYELAGAGGPRLFNVPLAVMPSDFGMAYIAFTLSQVLTRQYSKKLQGVCNPCPPRPPLS